MVQVKQISFQQSSKLAPPSDLELGIENGFIFAYRIINKETRQPFNDPQYLSVDIQQFNQVWENKSGVQVPVKSSTPISQQPCIKEQIHLIDDIKEDKVKRLQLEQFICPQDQKYKVRGSSQDDNFVYIQVSITKCNSLNKAAKCRKTEEIDAIIGKLEFQRYMDVRLFEGMITGYQKKIDIFVKNSTATLMNDYLRIQSPIQMQFYEVDQIEKYVNQYDENDREIMRFSLLASNKNEFYERKVFSIVEMFAQLGGIYNSLFTLGFLFCAAFSYNLFLSSLIRQLFHFRARFDSEISKKDKAAQSKTKSASREKKQQGTFETNPQETNASDGGLFELNHKRTSKNQIGAQEIKDEILEVVGRKRRANFNHKTVSILKSLMCCWIFRDRKHLRYDADRRKVLYFLKGRERLNKEMDVANIILDIRKIKYLMKILLDKDQRRLLQLKQTEYINSESEYDESNYKKSLKKDKLVDLYVDVLRSKKLKKSDQKLLEITGFKKILTILNSQKAFEKIASEWNDIENQKTQINSSYNKTNLILPSQQKKLHMQFNETVQQLASQLSLNDTFKKRGSNIFRAPFMNEKRDQKQKENSKQKKTRFRLDSEFTDIYNQSLLSSSKDQKDTHQQQESAKFGRSAMNNDNYDQFYDSPHIDDSLRSFNKEYEQIMSKKNRHQRKRSKSQDEFSPQNNNKTHDNVSFDQKNLKVIPSKSKVQIQPQKPPQQKSKVQLKEPEKQQKHQTLAQMSQKQNKNYYSSRKSVIFRQPPVIPSQMKNNYNIQSGTNDDTESELYEEMIEGSENYIESQEDEDYIQKNKRKISISSSSESSEDSSEEEKKKSPIKRIIRK